MAPVRRPGQFRDMRQGITAGLIALVASLASAAPALGETYLVQGTGDSATPPECVFFQPEVCTCSMLREAVNEANADPEADAIVVTPGTYNLSAGALELTNDVVISGGGARTTHLVAGLRSRVLEINGADVTVQALEIRGGAVPGGEAGGNINIASGSSLALTLMRVTGGAADQGAGIANSGTLTVQTSLIDDNTARFVGGGIWNLGGSTAALHHADQLDARGQRRDRRAARSAPRAAPATSSTSGTPRSAATSAAASRSAARIPRLRTRRSWPRTSRARTAPAPSSRAAPGTSRAT